MPIENTSNDDDTVLAYFIEIAYYSPFITCNYLTNCMQNAVCSRLKAVTTRVNAMYVAVIGIFALWMK